MIQTREDTLASIREILVDGEEGSRTVEGRSIYESSINISDIYLRHLCPFGKYKDEKNNIEIVDD